MCHCVISIAVVAIVSLAMLLLPNFVAMCKIAFAYPKRPNVSENVVSQRTDNGQENAKNVKQIETWKAFSYG